MTDRADLTLTPDVAEIARALGAVEALFDARPGHDAQCFSLSLALDEILTNIIHHGYDAPARGTIQLSIRVDGASVQCTVSDDGRAFDPTTVPDPDLDAPLEDRQIGGLGMHFVRESLSALSYARRDGRNVLSLRLDLPTA